MRRLYIIIVGCLWAFTLFFQFVGCNNGRIKQARLIYLKEKYSPETINYFYETVFFEDFGTPRDFAYKWKKDIRISLGGNLWPGDSSLINMAISELNALELPINLTLTNDPKNADMHVYVGDYSLLEQRINLKKGDYYPFLGIGKIDSCSSVIHSARIGIANDASSYAKVKNSKDSMTIRCTIILEELTQALGITGDSWAHPRSLFFEGKRRYDQFNELDKSVVRLLYEPAIPNKYAREQFESDFVDVLYHKNAEGKILKYIADYKIPVEYLQYIVANSFINDSLYKFPGIVSVNLKGDVTDADIEFCNQAISLINSSTKHLQLQLIEEDLFHDASVITIEFKKYNRNDGLITAERYVYPIKMMCTRRVKGDIKLNYTLSMTNVASQNLALKQTLFNAIYKTIGFDNCKDTNIITTDSLGNLQFNSPYKEILALLYEPIFYNGMTREELKKIIYHE